MSEIEETRVYQASEIQDEMISQVVKEVSQILEERGYNPINQIVGYLMSGDPGYISSHKEARNKITKFERTKILEILVKDFLTALKVLDIHFLENELSLLYLL